MRLLVLGSAAGGGVPQWNCRCPVCRLAWAGDPRVRARTQTGLAVSPDGRRWLLVGAAPDLRQQVLATPALHPGGEGRSSPIEAVLLLNGEVDHVAGLLTLRERQPFELHGTAATHAALDADPVFAVLDRDLVRRRLLVPGEPLAWHGLTLTLFPVPGKVPLYQESADVEVGRETDDVVGLEIVADGRRCLIVPNCAALTPGLLARLEGADLLAFDGTTYTDDEMVRLGVSAKTAARMGHMAMDGPMGSLAGLAGMAVGRRVYLHLNNTNPVLVEGSPERARVEAAGWELAWDGMELSL